MSKPAKAPDFKLTASDNREYSLSDFEGSLVVLFFYPKDDTPGCTKEACGFRDLTPNFKRRNTVLLGVSRDDIQSHGEFIQKYRLPFLLLSDPDCKLIKKYGAWGEKITTDGRTISGPIRSTVIIGPDRTVLKQWKIVQNAEEHPAEVLAWIDEYRASKIKS